MQIKNMENSDISRYIQAALRPPASTVRVSVLRGFRKRLFIYRLVGLRSVRVDYCGLDGSIELELVLF